MLYSYRLPMAEMFRLMEDGVELVEKTGKVAEKR
jgi:hypothetical protein